MPAEVWKIITRFPNYSVSNLGRVKKIAPMIRTHLGMLKLLAARDGYVAVTLSFNGLRKTIDVHRLVAMAFLTPDSLRQEVNHKNGNKTDNRLSNLEWATRSENLRHAYSVLGRKAKRGVAHPMVKLTEPQILSIRTMAGRQRDIAVIFGISQVQVWRIKHNHAWKHVPITS